MNSCSEVCYYDQFISTVIAAASDAGEPCSDVGAMRFRYLFRRWSTSTEQEVISLFIQQLRV